ncbi:MAG: hypothetical protein ACOY4K_02630 [Pseudomonadota bacterium]
MKRFLAMAVACLAMAACTTTNVKSATGLPEAPPQNARVLVAQPDIELSLLTASGLLEPRADWTASARANIQGAVDAALQGKSHKLTVLDPATEMEGREGQVLRLNGAVSSAIFSYGLYGKGLPSKSGFDWTLGEGAQLLAAKYGSDYALFVYGRGSYSSGGRVAMMIGAAALGVSIPMGGQQIYASLVELKTGRVIWFNYAIAAPNADMRTPEGARLLTESLLKGLPL